MTFFNSVDRLELYEMLLLFASNCCKHHSSDLNTDSYSSSSFLFGLSSARVQTHLSHEVRNSSGETPFSSSNSLSSATSPIHRALFNTSITEPIASSRFEEVLSLMALSFSRVYVS